MVGLIPLAVGGLALYVVGVVRISRAVALHHHRQRVSGASRGVLTSVIGFSLMAGAGLLLIPPY